MSIEFDNPKNLGDMRQITHEWIVNRPTIHHTNQSLAELLVLEIQELRDAVSTGKSIEEMSSEVGDVLFLSLALDDGNNPECAQVYSAVSKYCEICGTNMVQLFKNVHYKNRVNYPPTFFNEMTPFPNSSDAISCLRIVRRSHNSPEDLDFHWAKSDMEIAGMPFFDGYWATGMFREFVKSTLKEILENRGPDETTEKEIKRLLDIGEWGMAPFIIPGNVLNWHLF